MWPFLELVLARSLNIRVPKCLWLKGWILHCDQRPSVEVRAGVQQDQGQWQGAVEEAQQVPDRVPNSDTALWAAAPGDLQPLPWLLLPLRDQGLQGPAEYLLRHGFRLKRERYGVVHNPPSILPYSMQRGASLPASAPHRCLSSFGMVAGPSEQRDHATVCSDGNALPPALMVKRL